MLFWKTENSRSFIFKVVGARCYPSNIHEKVLYIECAVCVCDCLHYADYRNIIVWYIIQQLVKTVQHIYFTGILHECRIQNKQMCNIFIYWSRISLWHLIRPETTGEKKTFSSSKFYQYYLLSTCRKKLLTWRFKNCHSFSWYAIWVNRICIIFIKHLQINKSSNSSLIFWICIDWM